MDRSHSSWRRAFLLGKVEVLQDVQWSGLCTLTLVTTGEAGSTWEVRALKLGAVSL